MTICMTYRETTTYTRDSFSGLDYAVNRWHLPGMGRFGSADPYQASAGPGDPGSWNRYAYTRGDAVNRRDTLGLADDTAEFESGDGDGGICGSGWMTDASLSGPCGLGSSGIVAAIQNTAESTTPTELCPLVYLVGTYKTSGPNVDDMFAPDLAILIDGAISVLNHMGIVPVITDGFRTRADQQARWDKYQKAKDAGLPRCSATLRTGCWYPAARPGTGIHEIGDGIDFGHLANGSNWQRIADVLNSITGLNWGNSFNDDIHWETAHAPSPAQIANCEREHP